MNAPTTVNEVLCEMAEDPMGDLLEVKETCEECMEMTLAQYGYYMSKRHELDRITEKTGEEPTELQMIQLQDFVQHLPI